MWKSGRGWWCVSRAQNSIKNAKLQFLLIFLFQFKYVLFNFNVVFVLRFSRWFLFFGCFWKLIFNFVFRSEGKSENVTHDTTNTHNFKYTVKKISQQKHTIFLLWFLFQFQMMMIVMMMMLMTMSSVVSGCLYLQIDQLVDGGSSDAMNERKKIPTISLMLLQRSRQMKICNFKCTKPFCSPFALVDVHLSCGEYDKSVTTNNN